MPGVDLLTERTAPVGAQEPQSRESKESDERPVVCTHPLTGVIEVDRIVNDNGMRYLVHAAWSRHEHSGDLLHVVLDPVPAMGAVPSIVGRAAAACFLDYCLAWPRDRGYAALMHSCSLRLETYAAGYRAAMREDEHGTV